MVVVSVAALASLRYQFNKNPKGQDQSNAPTVEDAEKEEVPPPSCHRFWQYQEPAAKLYQNPSTEVGVACLIGANFMTSIVANTIDPTGMKYEGLWAGFEAFYNIVFTIELLVNMYAFWLCKFWRSGWNVFDFIVVSVGLLFMMQIPLPGPFKMLRMLRAFRVFRLFKRVKSLRKIMASLARAVPGVMNAFAILVLVMCIYAILGVEFWMEYAKDGVWVNEDNIEVTYQTNRRQDYGYEYFGNFPKSLYTMFQVMTTESWSEAVARPVLLIPGEIEALATAVFFVSFSIICGIILVNVAVAVLLEKMVDKTEDEEEAKADEDSPQRLNEDVTTIRADMQAMREKLVAIMDFIVRHGQDHELLPAPVGLPPTPTPTPSLPGFIESPAHRPHQLQLDG
mmetsp:Transcript_84577/g.217919  ORF Transcript_84577/g.217919 Transcript_84577/m.217919 type:complete len:396 (-) Transcript_84577:89-1276(-)